MEKLIRDRVAQIIEAKGQKAIVRVAGDEEYWQKLKEKLLEEVREYMASESLTELADILEVLDAIYAHQRVDKDELQRVKDKKAQERGTFSQRLLWQMPEQSHPVK